MYALPVYNLSYLEDHYKEVQFTIDYDTFLEMPLLCIRGETVKFASFIKTKNESMEKALKKILNFLKMSWTKVAEFQIYYRIKELNLKL